MPCLVAAEELVKGIEWEDHLLDQRESQRWPDAEGRATEC
jgi:hypothetical protein